MQKQASRTKLAACVAAVSLSALPMAATAGGYGTAGVADESVGQYASQGNVWCPKLEQNVPERLYSEMDCGGGGFARSEVAPERVENQRGLRGFFANFRHQPSGRSSSDDDDGNRTTSLKPTGGGTPSGPGTSPKPTTPDTPTTSASVTKWERLADFGVTKDNYKDADPGLREQIIDFRTKNGGNGDWSGFNPK